MGNKHPDKDRPLRPFALRTAVTADTKAKPEKDTVKISSAKHPAPQSTLFDLGVSDRSSWQGGPPRIINHHSSYRT